MKIFLALLTGFVLTLVTYAGGILTAVFFLDADPVPVHPPGVQTAAVSTSDPAAVDAAAQNLERLQAPPIRRATPSAAEPEAEETETAVRAEPLVDRTTTSAIPREAAPGAEIRLAPEPLEAGAPEVEALGTEPLEPQLMEPEPEDAPAMGDAHVQWCSERYRSYRPEDNSYTSYSGEKRECVSPFAAGVEEAAEAPVQASADRPFVGYAIEDEEPSGLTPEHVRSCFERYRSYRLEDNSYQPYGGGPRRQCR